MTTLSPALLMILTFILSGASISYEIILANTLSELSGNYVFWQGITIGLYILGIGLGTFKSTKNETPLKSLIKIELILTLIGAISVFFLTSLNISFKILEFSTQLTTSSNSITASQNILIFKTIYFLLTQSLTITVGFLTGYELPLLYKMVPKSKEKSFSKILGINYLGTLLGSLSLSLILMPRFDLIEISLVIAIINLLVAIFLILKNKKFLFSFWGFNASLLAMLILFLFLNYQSFNQKYLKLLYHHEYLLRALRLSPSEVFKKIHQLADINRINSPYQYIDFFETTPKRTKKSELVMMMDSHFQFSTYNEGSYHEAFAHIPLFLTKTRPKDILVLGAGDGLLIREILKHPEVENITHIELDPKVIDLFKTDPTLTKINKNALNHPKVKTLIQDAFYFIRNDTKKYDAIYIDFPYPNSVDLSRLYSLEFYQLVAKRLNTHHGFAVLDAPIFKDHEKEIRDQVLLDSSPQEHSTRILTNIHKESNNIILSTISKAGFKQYFPYQINLESFVLISMSNSEFDVHFADNNKEEDLELFKSISKSDLNSLSSQFFPHKIRKKYVNSIFHPKWKTMTL